MSYYKIKSVGIRENKVFITGACNNIIPIRYSRSESPELTKVLLEKGRDAVDILILKEFISGNFQGNATLYGKALIWQGVQRKEGVEIAVEDLMVEFKKVWSSKDPVIARYNGSPILKVTRAKFTMGFNGSGKIFRNVAEAKIALAGYDNTNISFKAELTEN